MRKNSSKYSSLKRTYATIESAENPYLPHCVEMTKYGDSYRISTTYKSTLQKISGLNPNSIYNLLFNDLQINIMSDSNGEIVFDDFPLYCIPYVIMGLSVKYLTTDNNGNTTGVSSQNKAPTVCVTNIPPTSEVLACDGRSYNLKQVVDVYTHSDSWSTYKPLDSFILKFSNGAVDHIPVFPNPN